MRTAKRIDTHEKVCLLAAQSQNDRLEKTGWRRVAVIDMYGYLAAALQRNWVRQGNRVNHEDRHA